MAKRLCLFFIIIFIGGCYNNQLTAEEKEYYQLVDELKKINHNQFSENFPFDINVYFDKIMESEIRYEVVIDNPRNIINNIKAIAIHDYETNDVFPNTGIFDEPFSMNPLVVDLKANYVKGVILIGYIPFKDDLEEYKGKVRVLVEYEDEISNINKIFFLSQY